MRKDYALENINEMKASSSMGAFGYRTNTIEHQVTWLLRHFVLRMDGDVKMLNSIYQQYGLDFDFTEQAEKADIYWHSYKKNNSALNSVTVKSALRLAAEVKTEGFEGFIKCLA